MVMEAETMEEIESSESGLGYYQAAAQLRGALEDLKNLLYHAKRGFLPRQDMIQAGSNIRRKFNEASARTRELEASSPHSPTVLTRIGEYRTEFRTEFETDYRTLAVRLGVRR